MRRFIEKSPRGPQSPLSRRDFLRVGGLGFSGIALPDLLRWQDATRAVHAADTAPSRKSIIIVYLNGGASQADMFDMKPQAPAEIRGEFQTIETAVPGLRICEHLPQQARLADRYTILTGMQVVTTNHSLYEAGTGFGGGVRPKRPAIGAVVSRFRTDRPADLPAWVNMGGESSPAFLGPAHAGFTSGGGLMRDLKSSDGIPAPRAGLLQDLDNMRNDLDATGDLAASDEYTHQALRMLNSTRVVDAFNLKQESPEVVERYGKASYGGSSLLLALRLAEAGVSMVTVLGPGNNQWDTHRNNFKVLRDRVLPQYDQSISAMIEDLYARGLERDVLIAIYGEFGRTPKINAKAGRDHYPKNCCVQLVGGGLKMGQVIGDTGVNGERDLSRSKPYTIQNLFATFYQHLGIDPGITVKDNFGRPQYLLRERDPISELL